MDRLSTLQARAEADEGVASFPQQRLWFMAQLHPDAPVYNESFVVRFHEPVDAAALADSLAEIQRRHPTWRTVFHTECGQLHQRVLPARGLPLRRLDLTDLPSEQRESTAHAHAVAEARMPFDLASGPLLKVTLVRLADDDHRLFLTVHHLVVDGHSFYQVFLPELLTLYLAFLRRRAAGSDPLAPLSSSAVSCALPTCGDPGAVLGRQCLARNLLGFLTGRVEHPIQELALYVVVPQSEGTQAAFAALACPVRPQLLARQPRQRAQTAPSIPPHR